MKPNLQNVTELVDQLAPKEQQQLLDYLALRKQQGLTSSRRVSGENRDTELWLESVTNALDAVLKSGGSSSPSSAVMKRTYSSSMDSVKAFMERSGLATLRVNERLACYQILSELLVAHAAYVARKAGAPLSPKLVFNCVGNLPGLFDNAYPGYLENGLAKAVVLRRSRYG